ncbi:hypothetical protein EHQ52_04240 [Leptospira koniambonensis]|uniref:Uncharacterized protein n=1 Tax=Leptospira koniambonensis TaxID=2484950 RepID=A0A4R9J7D7_9LEPT|nr:hypothetical protein EHQ52_04240 [Leptospira koniambonensis]
MIETGAKERKNPQFNEVKKMEIGSQTSQSLMIERIANLPREIFQAQSDMNSKLLKLNVEAQVQAQASEGRSRLLDLYV